MTPTTSSSHGLRLYTDSGAFVHTWLGVERPELRTLPDDDDALRREIGADAGQRIWRDVARHRRDIDQTATGALIAGSGS